MAPILIHYSVDEDASATNVKYLRRYFHELKAYTIPGIYHSAYRMGRADFLHVCYYPSDFLCEVATSLPAFKSFVKKLETIIEQEPIVNNIVEIGSYSG